MGCVVAAPFSAKSVAVTLTALVEGLALRAMVERAVVPDDDVVAPVADEIMLTHDATVVDGLPDDPRKAIIDGAAAEFAQPRLLHTTHQPTSRSELVCLADDRGPRHRRLSRNSRTRQAGARPAQPDRTSDRRWVDMQNNNRRVG